MTTNRFAKFASIALTAVAVVACGDEGDDETASVETYCEKSAALDEQDEFPSDAQIRELQEIAPEEIKDDLDAAGDVIIEEGEDAFEDEDVQERIERIEAFEEENCRRRATDERTENEDDGGDEDEWREQADKLCSEADDEIEEASQRLSDEPTPEELEEFVQEELVPTGKRLVEDLEELEPPAELEEDYEQYLFDLNDTIEKLRDMDGDELTEFLESEEDPFAFIEEQAEALGLGACGS